MRTQVERRRLSRTVTAARGEFEFNRSWRLRNLSSSLQALCLLSPDERKRELDALQQEMEKRKPPAGPAVLEILPVIKPKTIDDTSLDEDPHLLNVLNVRQDEHVSINLDFSELSESLKGWLHACSHFTKHSTNTLVYTVDRRNGYLSTTRANLQALSSVQETPREPTCGRLQALCGLLRQHSQARYLVG